jgi:hypothetical protein
LRPSGLRLSGLPLSHQHSYPTLSNALNIFSDGVFLLLFKTALFGLKQVLSNFYAIDFLWRRCNFREKETSCQAQSRKCRARYRDVAKTTFGIRQSNYLPLLLYRIPLSNILSWSCHVVFVSIAVCNSMSGNVSEIIAMFCVGLKRYFVLVILLHAVRHICVNINCNIVILMSVVSATKTLEFCQRKNILLSL